MIANFIIRKITNVYIHDYRCSMKAYRSNLIQDVNLYGEMHRFIPAYASWQGGKVTEIVVNHRPRIYGKTKYGLSRTFRVLLDLVVVKFLSEYMNRPMHFRWHWFYVFRCWYFLWSDGRYVKDFWLTLIYCNTTSYLFSTLYYCWRADDCYGVIAEILIRVYYESQNKTPYRIIEVINL